MQESHSSTPRVRSPLAWLMMLRWTAVAGQGIAVGITHYGLGVRLPLGPVLALLFLTAASNAGLWWWSRRDPALPRWLVPVVLAFDIVNLTLLLSLTGGAHNPFSSFYLVHVTLAAVLLPARWTWALAVLCTVCFGMLFEPRIVEAVCGDPARVRQVQTGKLMEHHLQGMLVAFALTSAAIAYFVVRVNELLRESERELARTRLLAAQNERFAALTTLAAGVAHELGSPLGTIAVASGELARAAREPGNADAVAEDARLIREEVARCRRILDRMNRDSTGGAEEEPQPTNGEEIVAQVSAQLRPAETARLKITDQTTGVRWRLPRALLAQSVANLVRNGCEASPAVAPVELRLQAEAGLLVIEVRDGGSGIASEDFSRLGEPFFTTKPPGQGMGLGLFLVRLFAQRVNGALEFESEPGRFTIARLRLPFPVA